MPLHSDVLLTLKPIVFISKCVGVLPLKFSNIDSKQTITLCKMSLILSLSYLSIAIIRDLYYIYQSILKHFFFSNDNTTAIQLINFIGMMFFCLYIFTILYFVYNNIKYFIIIIEKFIKINSKFTIFNYKTIQCKFVFYIIYVYQYYIYVTFDRIILIFNKNVSVFYNCCQELMSFMLVNSQLSIELQFFALCVLLSTYFKTLNQNLVTCLSHRKKFIIKIRFTYQLLHDSFEIINNIYGSCVLIYLCIRNMYLQYNLYLIIQCWYDVYFTNANIDVSLELKWLIFDIIRIYKFFSMCMEVQNQVRIINYIII
jgi:hypothetical protein